MAVSTQFPRISLSFEPSYLQFPRLPNPRSHSFVQIISKNNNFSLRRSQQNSVINSPSSSFITDPNSFLTQLCTQNELTRAVNVLAAVGKELPTEKEETLVSLLRLCEFKRASNEGSFIYSLLSNSIPHFSVRLGNALLGMFVRLGNLSDARYVFGKMPQRDLFSWNVLIGGYAKNGFFDEAIALYVSLLWLSVRPDVYTFPCVLRACGGLGNWERGREIHGHVLRFGFEANVYVVNSLITMYVKCGDVRNARMVFDKMDRRDRISWNAMIAGYFENNESLEGLRLFLSMRDSCFHPDLITMTSVISACAVFGDERLGKAVHGYVAKMAFGDDESLGNSLIQMQCSFGRLSEAETVFNRIECKDVVAWSSMITGYNNNGFANKAVETYKMMELEGRVSPDEFTVAGVLSACASLGFLDMGIKVHELAKEMGLIDYVMVANVLIHFYSKCKCIDKALQVFHQIPCKNVVSWTSIIHGLRINNRSFEALIYFRQMKIKCQDHPNDVTLLSVLSACARIGALMRGKEIHAHVLRSGLAFEGFLPNAILDMYVRCGRMVPAGNQFKTRKHDVTFWNTLLTGHAERGEGALATELFHEMIKSEVRPNEITFTALLCACSRSGMVTEGMQYFDNMETRYSVSRNLKHYACVVDLLGRAGELDNAHEFIEKMPITPDQAIWGALLNACRIHRRVELGEIAAEHIIGMDNRSVECYTMLCNLYSDSGKWNEVAKVRKTMREMGLDIDPGCSWVEVKGTIHAFLSGDSSHPQIREITGILQEIYAKMKATGHGDPERSFMNEVEALKAGVCCGHSERMAVAFGLINTSPGMPICVTKNLYMCESCHNTMKFVTKAARREISVRDTENFHHFKDGSCSCGDEEYCGRAFLN